MKYAEEYNDKNKKDILLNHVNLSKLMIIVKTAAETRRGRSIHGNYLIYV